MLLPILMPQESFWWWQCSDRYISLPPPPPPSIPLPPSFSPSLISRTVSVDVKRKVQGFQQVCKMTIEMIDNWVTNLRFNEMKNEKMKKKKIMLVFNRFYFLYAGRDCCLGFSISHVTFSEVTSVWGVSAVAILDFSLNVYACGRQRALAMPAYCIAANCNNSQATQSITMHEFPRNRPAVRRKWVNWFVSTIQTSRLWCCASVTPISMCSEHFAECNFINFMAEYQMGFVSKRNLQNCPQGNWPVKKSSSNLQGWSSVTSSKRTATVIPKTERYPDTLKQALTRQTQKV